MGNTVGDVTLVDTAGLPLTPNKELTQTDIQNIQESIQEMLSQLKFLSSVRGIAADLRVTLLSGVVTTVSTVSTVTTVATVTTVTTVATVTTVGTVTNLAQVGAQPAQQVVPAIQNQLAQLANVANTSGY